MGGMGGDEKPYLLWEGPLIVHSSIPGAVGSLVSCKCVSDTYEAVFEPVFEAVVLTFGEVRRDRR